MPGVRCRAGGRSSRDAGFPDGAYVNVYATNEQVEHVIADPRVQGVSLTGSERAGAAVAEIAGRHLKKVVLELGGSDPFIVLSTDDLDATVDAAVDGPARQHRPVLQRRASASSCTRASTTTSSPKFTSRLLETAGRRPALVGGGRRAARPAGRRCRRTRARPSRPRASGEGACFPPGVLTGVTPGDAASHQELFGPVAMVFKVRDEDEAVAVANDTPVRPGLLRLHHRPRAGGPGRRPIDAGMVFVNGVGAEGAELPFGGVKRSGFGRELGRSGIEEFVNKKLVRTVR